MPESRNFAQTYSYPNIEGNGKFKERKLKESSSPFPTVMCNVHGPSSSHVEIVNIALRKGQTPVSFNSGANWEASVFRKNYSTGKNHFNGKREILITPSKYVHVRLKCDDRFAANPQCIFHAVDWIERNAIASSVYHVEKNIISKWKQFRSISESQQDQIFSSFKTEKFCNTSTISSCMSLPKFCF